MTDLKLILKDDAVNDEFSLTSGEEQIVYLLKERNKNQKMLLDELDMAAYQIRELRDTPQHDDLIRWGDDFLSGKRM